jgi:hypothetical protein
MHFFSPSPKLLPMNWGRWPTNRSRTDTEKEQGLGIGALPCCTREIPGHPTPANPQSHGENQSCQSRRRA